MLFETAGNRENPVVLFFHAMGVTGKSSAPVVKYLKDSYFCILPTSSVYCRNQKYVSRSDEVGQIVNFLHRQDIREIALVVASSLGADLAMEFLSEVNIPINYVYFDGGQFAQMSKWSRHLLSPFLYTAMKSISWSKGKTLKYIFWSQEAAIQSYFMMASRNLTYSNLYRQMSDSLEKRPFPEFPYSLQKHMYFAFGSKEEHYVYRKSVKESYPDAHFPVFEGYDHMQYQIQDPEGFASMLDSLVKKGSLPKIACLRK